MGVAKLKKKKKKMGEREALGFILTFVLYMLTY